jgi:hypothetical protein
MVQGAACRYSTSPKPPHFNHTSYELSTEDKFEIMEMCNRWAPCRKAANSAQQVLKPCMHLRPCTLAVNIHDKQKHVFHFAAFWKGKYT